MNSRFSVNKALIASTVLAISFILLVGPTLLTMNVFAQGNKANQGIGQSQSSTQLGVCVSGDGTLFSCNNLNAQSQTNSGNNALAQSGGGGKSGGNQANQAIGQSQSSNQNALCVSGTGTFVSCNNLSAQSQTNTGNNAAAQQGGSGGKGKSGGNSINQGIGQSQSSNQKSGVVSGGDTTASGNNVNDQSQTNTGNNAAAQQ
ncbi:MAG TPA: hypothetical protein VFG45_01730 [Candidatus Nitrosocosmicus sp.]|nr:hypothetical protein [Candidatus Nitrosocosmicus sp.]